MRAAGGPVPNARIVEGGLYVAIAASAIAFGGVHWWAHAPLWGLALCLGAVLMTWPSRPVYAPLFAPGLAFAAWAALQLVPIPPAIETLIAPGKAATFGGAAGWRPLTVSPAATVRGLGFVLAMLTFHLASAAVFAAPRAFRRLCLFVATLGALLALAALAQKASGSDLVYGVVAPTERVGALVFGPFVNRNHFAGYMLMVVPLTCACVEAARARRHGAPALGSIRGLLRLVDSPGIARLAAPVIALLISASALLATTSRGALLAFVLSLAVVFGLRRRPITHAAAPLLLAALIAVPAAWFGLDRLHARFARAGSDMPSRTEVWKDALRRTAGLRLTGTGFNTFAAAISRTRPWPLPHGATPWPAAFEADVPPRAYRTPPGLPVLAWYREAHSDYVQLLVETGIVGVLLGVWMIVRVLRHAATNRWILMAVLGVLMHVAVDFDFQIPAVAVLFAVLSALPGPPGEAA